METIKKQFYFNGINSEIIVYPENLPPVKLNISEFIKTFNCEFDRDLTIGGDSSITIKKYKVKDNVHIDSLDEDGNLTFSKIDYILCKEGLEENALYDLEYNNDIDTISNIAIFDKKKNKIVISPGGELDQKFIIQNIGKYSNIQHNTIGNVELNMTSGFIVGYWLQRGTFGRVDRTSEDEFIMFRGKAEDSNFIMDVLKANSDRSVSYRKQSTNDFEFLIMVNNDLQDLISEKFFKKTIPIWLLQANTDFLKGLFYSFVYCRSYISKDKNNNNYLVVTNKNKELLHGLNYLCKQKFGIYSKFISNNGCTLSFKINKKLHELLQEGVDEKLIIANMKTVEIADSKEFFVKGYNYKIIPWYKIKTTPNLECSETFTLKMEDSKIFMLANGLFVLG